MKKRLVMLLMALSMVSLIGCNAVSNFEDRKAREEREDDDEDDDEETEDEEQPTRRSSHRGSTEEEESTRRGGNHSSTSAAPAMSTEAPAETNPAKEEATADKEAEAPAAEVSTEAPATEAPATETPATEAPATEAPMTDPQPPAVLLSMKYATVISGGMQVIDSCADVFGNTYTGAIAGTVSDHDNVIEYELGCDIGPGFETFSGTIIRDAGANVAGLSNPNRTDITVTIYGDGVMLYRSMSVNLPGAEKQEFVLDVSDVTTLRIVINGKNFIRLVNALLVMKP